MPVPGAVDDTTVLDAATVSLDAARGPLDAYMARPAGLGTRPGLIVIHEAFGLNDHIRDVARRFANAGFDVLAPDLYTRIGAPKPDDVGSIFEKMLALADAEVVADLGAAASRLRSLETSNGKVGCIGFCSGGRHTLLFALSSPAVDAAIDCWGGFIDRASPDDEVTANRPTAIVDLADRVRAPLFLVGGVEDTNPSPDVLGELERRLRATGATDLEVRIFPDAGHAFLADNRPSYRERAAHELWPMLLDFLRRHLR